MSNHSAEPEDGTDPVVLVAVVLAVVLVAVIILLVMCWKFRSKKHSDKNGGGNIVLSNPNPDNGERDAETIALAKSKLTTDPFDIKGSGSLKGDDKKRFDEISRQLGPERMKFLVILNALRRDAKQINIESEIFDTYRRCIHELSRFLYLVNHSPGGQVPDDGLLLAQWAQQILSIYDNENRIIAIPYSYLDIDLDSPTEGFPIQQLRSSMRAQRRSSVGSSSEASSINDIRVDLESEDEEEEVVVTNPYEDVEEGQFRNDEDPVQFSKLSKQEYY